MQSRDANDDAPHDALDAASCAARGAARDTGCGDAQSARVREPVVPFRFACHRCGHCCSGGAGHVWLAPGEGERLARALGLSPAAFERRHVRTVIDPRTGELRSALREANTSAEHGGRCSLLAGSNVCTAYTARPEHCRTFPYWPSVLADRDAFEAARATCPGIAVEAPEAVRAGAFAELAALYATIGPAHAEGGCCLASARPDAVYATALEADFAVAMRADSAASTDQPENAHGASDPPCGTCRLGRGAPLACRLPAAPAPASDALFARVRAIERAHAYPAAYGRLAELLHTRGLDCTLDETARTDEDGPA